MKRLFAVLLSVLLLVGLLAACGDNGGTQSSEPTSSESSESVSSETPDVSEEPDASKEPDASEEPDTSDSTTTTAKPIDSDTERSTTSGITRPSNSKTSTTKTTKTTKATGVEINNYKDAVAPLANSKYLLTKQNKLNVAYIGGSITAGYGSTDGNSWREKTTAWFKQTYPNAAITEINAASGGTGTYYAKHRMDEDMLKYKPDLVFVEFVVNDKIDGCTAKQSQANMETIVRKCYNANPNMDIVFVYTTTVAIGTGKSNTWIDAFNKVAKQYGIETIYAGAAMANAGQPLKSLFMDDQVHPVDAGYAVLADEVISRVTEILGKAGNPTKTVNHVVPPILSDGLNINTKIFYAEDIKAQNASFSIGTQSFVSHTDKSADMKKGESFTFKFTGDSVGIYWYGGNTTISCYLDGVKIVQKKALVNSNGSCFVLFDDLDMGEHTLTFTNNGKVGLRIPMVFATV